MIVLIPDHCLSIYFVIWGYSRYIFIQKQLKYLLNVRLAGDHLHGKLLFTWLSLVFLLWCLFVLFFSPRDVLDETLDWKKDIICLRFENLFL